MKKLTFESLESRVMLAASPDSLLVHVEGDLVHIDGDIDLPPGYQLGWVGQSGYTSLRFDSGTIQEALQTAANIPGLDYVGLNPEVETNVIPNDPLFDQLWGMVKISAPAAWDIVRESADVVLASIDTGVNMSHPDLDANIWTNDGEIPGNGIDDDDNGLIDDVHGWDFRNGDNDPSDDNSHGSHTSGTFGGEGNNAEGVVGVSWNVQIMPIKAFSSGGSGSLADIIQGIDYSTMMGAQISNNSWGGQAAPDSPSWQPLKISIEMAGSTANQLFVASAGNSNTNNDTSSSKNLPAAWDSANILSVAASDQSDAKASFSSYGLTTIDVAAPGVGTLSSCLEVSYCTKQGTSMAAPHVSGVAALIAQQQPEWTFQQIKDQIIGTVDVVGPWGGLVASGGRLNALAALGSEPPPPPENHDPVAADDVASTPEDTAVTIDVLANDTDADGDALGVQAVTQPANGFVGRSGTNVTYVPDADFNGVDTFEYTVTDGNGGSDTATVTVTVTAAPVNLPPVAVDDVFAGKQDEVLTVRAPGVLANDTDPDGDALTSKLLSEPVNGVVELMPDGGFSYTPNAGFSGTDQWTYNVSDGEFSDLGSVAIQVDPTPLPPVNLPPIAVDDVFTGKQNEVLTVPAPGVLANDTDPDGDTLTSALNSPPANGTLELMPDGSFSYTPNDAFFGADTWMYKVSDGEFSDEGVVTITILPLPPPPPPNSAPIGEPDFYSGKKDIHIKADKDKGNNKDQSLVANDRDPDGDVFAAFLFSQPLHGEMKSFGFDGSFHYSPDEKFEGVDTFEYRIIDQWGNVSDPILVTLTIGKNDKNDKNDKDKDSPIDLRNDTVVRHLMVS